MCQTPSPICTGVSSIHFQCLFWFKILKSRGANVLNKLQYCWASLTYKFCMLLFIRNKYILCFQLWDVVLLLWLQGKLSWRLTLTTGPSQALQHISLASQVFNQCFKATRTAIIQKWGREAILDPRASSIFLELWILR